MRMLRALLTNAALCLALSGTAYAAGVLITPPLQNNDHVNGLLACRVLNVSTRAHSVTIEIFDSDGVSVSAVTESLAPGNTGATDTNDVAARWCKITVNDGGKSAVTGTLCVLQFSTGCLASTVAQ